MILNTYFHQPVATYFDLAFANPFADDGVDAERIVGMSAVFTTTYGNGLQHRSSLVDTGSGSFRLGDVDILAPSGRPIARIALEELGIETDAVDTLDLAGFVDRVKITFTGGDDTVPLGPDLEIRETRGDRTEEVLGLEGTLPFTFDFGEGRDRAVLDTSRGDVALAVRGDGLALATPDAEGLFENLETLAFNDGALVLDETGDHADYTYALYAAALVRTPDEDGFRFWNGVMDSGAFGGGTREEAELRLAAEFVRAPEFTQRFDVTTNAAFVNALYANVLRREAEAEGFDYWLGVFDTGALGRADMLRFFALSDENAGRIAEDIDTGYWVI